MTDSTCPVQTLRYGAHDDQFGRLRLPEPGSGRAPVAVLLHGGFWLAQWTLALMDPIADDLVRRGFATWNVEYRRADTHGWEAMSADVETALRHLDSIAEQHRLDLDRIVLIGHSAGGQLAARVCTDLLAGAARIRPALVISLAGVVDLVDAAARDLGDGAVPHALGGTPAELPDRYAASSPMQRLPLHSRLIVVNAEGDHRDLNEMQRSYAAAARAAGDEVELIEGPGDHFTLIDPRSELWERAMTRTSVALEHAAVARHIEGLYAAFGDRDRFDRHLDPQITIWESDADRLLIGLDELDRLRDERAARAAGAEPRPSVTAEQIDTQVWDDTAIARYLLRASYDGGEVADSEFRVTDVLRRGADGWRIVHHHSEALTS